MRAVNLLPRELDQGRKGPPVAIVTACAGAVLATAVLAGGYLQASSKVGDANAKLASLETELAAIPKPADAESSALTSLSQERQQRVTALAAALSQRVSWDRILREVSLVLPEDVWLSTLQAQAPSSLTSAPTVPGSTTAVSNGFTLTGFTYSQESVARLLSRLSLIPDLAQVQLTNATQQQVSGKDVIQFTVTANVKGPGAAS